MGTRLETLRRRFRRLWYSLVARFEIHVLLRWWDVRERFRDDPFLEQRERRRQGLQPRCELLELRWLMSSGVTEFTIPTASSGAQMICQGPDGNLWLTESSVGKIAKVSTSGSFTEYSLGSGHAPWDIVVGPDGNLWYTDFVSSTGTGYVGKITTSGTVTEYALAGSVNKPADLAPAVGIDGNIWVADQATSKVIKVTPSGSLTSYTVPGSNDAPQGIVAGPDGNIWITQPTANEVSKVTSTGSFTGYTVGSNPQEITLGGDGNLWFTMQSSNSVGRITPGGQYTSFFISSGASPFGITEGPDGNIWLVENGGDAIDRVTPDGTVTQVATLPSGSSPEDICTGPDGLLWLTEKGTNKVAKLAYLTNSYVRTDVPGGGGYNPGSGSAAVGFGTGSASPQTGDYSTQVPLDFGQNGSLGTDDSPLAGGQTALVYHSDAVSVYPIVETTFATDAGGSVPTTLKAQLTWNGSALGWVTFGTSGHSAGDVYDLALQDTSAVTSTGNYSWSVEVEATLPGGATIDRTDSGTASVVVEGSGDAFGYGWGLAGFDNLVSVTNGYVWVYGAGGSRFFYDPKGGLNPPVASVGSTSDPTTGVKNQDNSTTWTAADGTKTTFDSSGNLLKVVDTHGLAVTYSYSSGRLSGIAGPDGGLVTFAYDTNNLLLTIQEPGSRTLTFSHDASGNLTAVTMPDGSLRTFAYDTGHHQTTDRWGPLTATMSYSATTEALTNIDRGGGTTLGVVDAAVQGLVTTTAINSSAAVGVLTDGLSHATTFTLDPAGFLTKLETPDGATQSWSRDFGEQPTTYTDGLNHVTTMAYLYGTSKGDLVKVTRPDGNTEQYAYESTFQHLTQSTDALGRLNTFTYDATTGDLLTSKDGLGNVTTYTWSNGLEQTVTDPLGHTTTFQWDGTHRRLTDTVEATGSRATYSYDGAGNVTSVQDARGYPSTYAYDGMRHLLTEQDAAGGRVTYTYTAIGEVSTVTDQLGHVTSYSYDQHGWNTSIMEAVATSAQRTTTMVYDAVGNETRTIDPAGYTVTYQYDGVGRQTSIQDAGGGIATMVYDAAGDLVQSIDQLGQKTTYGYDSLNRQTQTIDPRGGITTTVFDAVGNTVNVIDADGNKTTFTYDNANNLTQQTDALGHSATFAYDQAGRLTSTTDRDGRLRSFTYDADNRETGETWTASGSTQNVLTFTYDAVGNELTAADYAGTYTMSYDGLDRETATQEPFAQTLTASYDAVGNRTQLQDSQGGLLTSVYDALNRLTSRKETGQAPVRIDFTYTARDDLASVSRYSDLAGTTTVAYSAYSYDGLDRVTNIEHQNGSGTNLANFTYTYDVASRLTTEVTNGTTKTYSYDANNELTNDSTKTYSYDATGNRTMTGYQTGTGNQLLNDGVYTYTYDNEGNLTEKSAGHAGDTWLYGYDNRNRLVWVEHLPTNSAVSMLATYVYDALGNRVEKDVGQGGVTTVTRFDYDGNQVWADLNGSNALLTRYVHGDQTDQLFARVSSTGTVAWYLTDRLGSVRNLTDNSGVVQDTITYDGYGNATETNAASGDRYKFTGRELDSETGLQYNRARYYDPASGRWTSQDPLGFEAGDENLYRYVANNPLDNIDPSGRYKAIELNPWQLHKLYRDRLRVTEQLLEDWFNFERYFAKTFPDLVNSAIFGRISIGIVNEANDRINNLIRALEKIEEDHPSLRSERP